MVCIDGDSASRMRNTIEVKLPLMMKIETMMMMLMIIMVAVMMVVAMVLCNLR